MGFPKYANATVVTSSINVAGWDEIRQNALGLGPSFESRKATQVVLDRYDPNKFLLTHCSIIASVDTETPGMPKGIQMFDGLQINRKYADFYVSPDTTKYINNNHDCWERKLLLACFRTFVGGENYVEHIQIPELSKGKIIDAAARDIGDSIYVDILVATDKRHDTLIRSITSGELSTLSMGAQVAFTICTKCGNVAEDELQLCRHIKYQKGNFFLDAMGKRRKIAELCGHIDAEPGSVKFIEASWVANPAFTGAVLRNILDPTTALMAEAARRKIQVAFSQPVRVVDPKSLQKAAKLAPVGIGAKALRADHLPYLYEGEPIGVLHASTPLSATRKAEATRKNRQLQIRNAQGDQGFGGFGDQDSGSQDPGSQGSGSQDKKDPLSKPVNDLYDSIVDKVVDKVRTEIDNDEADKTQDALNENSSNESLIKSAMARPEWKNRAAFVYKVVGRPSLARTILSGLIMYEAGGWSAIAKSRRFSGNEILAMSRLLDRMNKRASSAGESRVYKTVMIVGGAAVYPDVDSYLAACREVVGRSLTEHEKVQLIEKGKLYSLGTP